MDAPAVPDAVQPPTDTPIEPPTPTRPLQELLDEGNKALATRKYPEAIDSYSLALEQLTALHGELAPEVADVLVLYGKALLRNAVMQSGVLGGTTAKPVDTGDASAGAAEPVAGPSTVAPTPIAPIIPLAAPSAAAAPKRNFHFGGDEPEEEGEDAEEGGDEPEEAANDPDDDLETAFGVLDQAKVIYQKIEGDEVKLKLAEVHDALGEVLTESEKFDDAVQEFETGLKILSDVLETQDRRIAEAHMMIALALEYVTVEPEAARKRAIEHAEKSKSTLELKLSALRQGGQKEAEAEIKDIEEVMQELDMKIDDLKTAPIIEAQTEADKLLQQSLGKPTMDPSAPVNNLNTLVKKKKKPAETSAAVDTTAATTETNGKRKADELGADVDPKKARIDDASSP